MVEPLDLVTLTDAGLYCAAGDFHIDPWRPVPRAVITHAHADHARPGHASYLAARDGEKVLRVRLGPNATIDTVAYGEGIDMNGVRVSLHPAGHVLGSAQVRIEYRGEVWVVSGDYRVEADVTCTAFEPVRCDAFVTESTFGLPIYRWRPQVQLFAEIDAWWRENQEAGEASVLFAYAFGKAQRLLAGVDASLGPIVCHGAVEPLNAAYRESGVPLPRTLRVSEIEKGFDWSRALVVAPPSAQGTPWLRRFGDYSDALRFGLDVDPRRAPPPCGGSRLCPFRSRGLARTALCNRSNRGAADLRDPRSGARDGALARGTRLRRTRLRDALRRRAGRQCERGRQR